jgi:hypothetical protein
MGSGPGQTPAGWYTDPGGGEQRRYWDGAQWTERYQDVCREPAAGVDRIRFTSATGDDVLLIFDGAVLEIFKAQSGGTGAQASERFHRDLLTIIFESQDRNGVHKVWIYGGHGVHLGARSVGKQLIYIAEQDRPVIDFLTRVRAALPAP